MVARLLQESRVRAIVDVQDSKGDIALHWACFREDEASATSLVHLLLQANANPLVINTGEQTPLAVTRQYRPTRTTTIALLEQALAEAETTSLLVKARRFVVAARSNVIPPRFQGRVAGGKPLPRVELRRLMLQLTLTGAIFFEAEQCRKLRNMMSFILGMSGGPEGEGMPRDVFRGVFMDLLMPMWDPLRRKRAGQPQEQR